MTKDELIDALRVLIDELRNEFHVWLISTSLVLALCLSFCVVATIYDAHTHLIAFEFNISYKQAENLPLKVRRRYLSQIKDRYK